MLNNKKKYNIKKLTIYIIITIYMILLILLINELVICKQQNLNLNKKVVFLKNNSYQLPPLLIKDFKLKNQTY